MCKQPLLLYPNHYKLNTEQFTRAIGTILIYTAIVFLSCWGLTLIVQFKAPEFSYFHTPFDELNRLQMLCVNLIDTLVIGWVVLFIASFAWVVTRRITDACLPPWLAPVIFIPGVGSVVFMALFLIPTDWAKTKDKTDK
ncbi:hypothetical protein [Vibrio mediterranei]|uniref:hypothetical protein n=1 Tax=Vibrio mediterranei TaxID=689 RepID=UPI004068716E